MAEYQKARGQCEYSECSQPATHVVYVDFTPFTPNGASWDSCLRCADNQAFNLLSMPGAQLVIVTPKVVAA